LGEEEIYVRKSLLSIIAIICLLILVSCSNKTKDSLGTPKMLEVNLSVNPEKAEPNQPVVFEAKVTQGKENVNDADEVVFEIWRSNDKQHQEIKINHPKNGVYRLEKSFSQEGTYYIISHVTARDMHNMPKKEFTVGTPSEPEDQNTNASTMDGMK